MPIRENFESLLWNLEAIISLGRGEMIYRHKVKVPAEIPSAKPTGAGVSKGVGR